MKGRTQLAGAILAALCLAGCGADETAQTAENREKILERNHLSLQEIEVDVPEIEGEHEILFLADTHLSLCDERDPELQDKAAQRYASFADAEGRKADETFRAWMEYIKWEQPELVIFGGDILDSAMYASIDLLKEEWADLPCPYVYSMGNHDFEYGTEYYTQTAFENYLPRLETVSEARDGFQMKDCGDYLVFALDDYNNRYAPQALEGFREAAASGKPILLVTHVPLEPMTDDRSLIEASIDAWGASGDGKSRVVLGRDGLGMDETTLALAGEILAQDSPVCHVLAGHVHFPHEDRLTDRISQTVTEAGYEGGGVRLILN